MRKLLRPTVQRSRQVFPETSTYRYDLNDEGERGHFARLPEQSAAQIARYIAQLTREMVGMAGAARLDMLAYLLQMAQAEAEMLARAPLENGAGEPAPRD